MSDNFFTKTQKLSSQSSSGAKQRKSRFSMGAKLFVYVILVSFWAPVSGEEATQTNIENAPAVNETKENDLPAEQIPTESANQNLAQGSAKDGGQSHSELFNSGVALYQQKKFQEAAEKFMAALEKKPDDFSIVFNLALTNFELKDFHRALAYFRMADQLNPTSQLVSKSIMMTLQQKPISDIARELPAWEVLRQNFLAIGSLNLFLGITAVLLAFDKFQKKTILKSRQKRTGQ
jgi:tetratricopeptide (TPR) repeat protein